MNVRRYGEAGARPERDTRHPGPRAVALRVLLCVLGGGESLSRALPPVLVALTNASDRAFAQALVYGVLRYGFRLERALGHLLRKPLKQRDLEVKVCLLLGMYQLAYLRTPPHAAVSETMALVHRQPPWARGLVNGVLRHFARDADQILAHVDRNEEARLSHPPWLLAALRSDWPDEYAALAAANNKQAPMCLRVNRLRASRDAYIDRLAQAGIRGQPTPHASHGIHIAGATDPREFPGYAEGWFTVQDAAAQLAGCLLGPRSGERVLDACAAPGGKTGHLIELAPDARIIALERDRARAARLEANLQRLRHRAEVIVADAARPEQWWDGNPFDRVLLDVPCTGTGIIRRHPDIKVLRRADDVTALVQQQARLLDALWPTLAEGGHLLYATCSVLRDENGAQVARFLAGQTDATEVPITAVWGRSGQPGRQILPGEDDMDGFYYALLRKGA